MGPIAAGSMEAWFDLCHRSGVRLGPASAMGEELIAAYAEPHRHYHTINHIQACLGFVGGTPLEPHDRDVVELAVWFHDVIYAPERDDNEEQSALLALRWLTDQGVDGAERVAQLIRMTAGHDVAPSADFATKVVHDVDLAVLGADPDRYDDYAGQIRREYGWLADEVYAAGRRRVLERFLGLEAIYVLPAYAAEFEASARQNLTRELGLLTA